MMAHASGSACKQSKHEKPSIASASRSTRATADAAKGGLGTQVFKSQGKRWPCRQGNRVLTEQDFEEVVVPPATCRRLPWMPTFRLVSRFSWLWAICLSVAMFWGLWSLRIRLLVLPEGDIQAPVQRVLNAPVCPRRPQHLLSRCCQAADVIPGVHRGSQYQSHAGPPPSSPTATQANPTRCSGTPGRLGR